VVAASQGPDWGATMAVKVCGWCVCVRVRGSAF
jgi:hypothetical protein